MHILLVMNNRAESKYNGVHCSIWCVFIDYLSCHSSVLPEYTCVLFFCHIQKHGYVVRPRMTTCSSLNQTKVHMGTNQKVLQSYISGTGWESAALPGSTRISCASTWCGCGQHLLKKVGSCGKDAPDVLIPAYALRS